ncbi:MAG: hypothetical protein AUH10_03730 [Gammaproteobacteria bacterium 13_2_20CM_66_19]|nr:MAG: hypothetical protein AUH10_03730 [Gammaproteobacteria bacterium 13_2_20CM_66_19]
MGMVAALGNGVAMNCAAARAGIVRAQALENYRIRSAVDGEEEPVIGHAAGLLTRGFEGDARLVRLAHGALLDLLAQTPHIDWKTRPAQFYLSLPASGRAKPNPNQVAHVSAATDLERARRILTRSAELAAWPQSPRLAAIKTSGHAGALEAVQAALDDLQAGRAEMAIILAIDSLLDAGSLDWLHASNRLKCDAAPDGLQPGEAGVAIVLTIHGSAPPASCSTGRLLSVHIGEETRHLLSAESARGEALAEVVAHAWADAGVSVPWLILDQNGEVHRALDWGHALVRLRAWTEAFAAPAVWYPAASFGDTGAASALLGICMSVRAWERDYAPSESAIVASVSDGKARAAVAVLKS